MAVNVMTPIDVHEIINAACQAMYGQDTTIQAVDTSSFATVGQAMLASGYEKVMNALGMVLGRTYLAVRPYTSALPMLNMTEDEYAGYSRKISFFSKGAEQSCAWNTDLDPEGLKDGNSVDPYVINKRYPLELTFVGTKVWQEHYTRFPDQLKSAFQDEASMAAFLQGMMVEFGNDLESQKEATTRLTLLNHIGAIYNVGNANMKVNLVTLYNTKYGTSYTTSQLLTEHFQSFLGFFVSTVKIILRRMRNRNNLFHLTPVKNDDAGQPLTLLRHTPTDAARMLLYGPMFIEAESQVFPTVFNENYLRLDGYDTVDFWQDINDPTAVSVTPNQLNVTTGQAEQGKAVSLKNVVGLIYDRDALFTNFILDRVISTPPNAAGNYVNTYYHWGRRFNSDLTENSVLLYMEDAA